jgi:formylglycine-generating enzyme
MRSTLLIGFAPAILALFPGDAAAQAAPLAARVAAAPTAAVTGAIDRPAAAKPAAAKPAAARPAAAKPASSLAMVRIPGGSYRPLYEQSGAARVQVASFQLEREPVTRGEFRDWLRENPQWRRSRIASVFAVRAAYLSDWRGDLEPGDATDLRRPVVNVSWHAARAYCAARGARLPTVQEWEYAAAASDVARDATGDPAFIQQLTSAYSSRPRPLPPAADATSNVYGIRAMHGFQSEWVEDFNSVLVSDDSRAVGERDRPAWCASSTIGALDPNNYPAFLRFALRSALSSRDALETLGFRCAR